MITTQQAIKIFTKSEKCATDDCPVTEGCDICPYNVSKEEYEEAIKMAITALKNFSTSSLVPIQMSGASDLVSRQYLLDEYDRQHVGPPGGARKIIEEAPSVEVPNNPANSSEIPNSSNELISRQEVLTAIRTSNLSAATVYGRSERGMAVAKELVRLINGIPAFQEKQKTGHWIKRMIVPNEHFPLYIHDCSECGGLMFGAPTNFCPYCGAKMEDKTDGDM